MVNRKKIHFSIIGMVLFAAYIMSFSYGGCTISDLFGSRGTSSGSSGESLAKGSWTGPYKDIPGNPEGTFDWTIDSAGNLSGNFTFGLAGGTTQNGTNAGLIKKNGTLSNLTFTIPSYDPYTGTGVLNVNKDDQLAGPLKITYPNGTTVEYQLALTRK